MASSPPASPSPQRPALTRTTRSLSRLSTNSRPGGSSRASDEEGKTPVKVAVRVRPPLKATDPGYDLIPHRFQRSTVQVTSPTSLAIESPQGKKLFVFDRVFSEDIEQDGVWEYLQESVNAFVQGYNVSVLAYGQSGAGKSYTMGTSGPEEQSNLQSMGVIPRAARVLFSKLAGPPSLITPSSSGLRTPTRYSMSSVQTLASLAKANEDKNWQMKATYVEIYNEQLRDLLVPDSIPPAERSAVTIREDNKGHILLTGLHQVTINSVEDLLGALNFGSTIRQTDATVINAKSSRSHAVLSLNLIQRKAKAQPSILQDKRFSVPLETMAGTEGWVTVDSKLHFVDLAGSERLKNTGASGERAKEGISINAGLASLGKVISQLSSRSAGSHVSYRDSRLTRLLQDSLGGNAITYMVACVTPAEFHLSETLNTVQYAQRARAIQSKPRIQQVSEESDKQAVIDRLRAEVSFLRDQISNAERGDRRSLIPHKRDDRQNEREVELQNHLLDVQENYTALSQRHAKLISEITKARTNESSDTPTLTEAIGDSAVERLKRSNSFAEAVEQVVLEYETTIQSLETSLSNTRSSLANTESSLLERETRCAYVETMNQQLHNRIEKLIDRESSTEQYLQDLEAKLDGQSTGEEKNSAIVVELRREIARIRENEASCEDYISTLEERLAETDQDMELMQREVERLEHVVERQRSLGKLDNLLYELDHIQADGVHHEPKQSRNRHGKSSQPVFGINWYSKSTDAVLEDAVNTPMPDSDYESTEDTPQSTPASSRRATFDVLPETGIATNSTANHLSQTSAQSKFVADKLDTVTQELLELRIEHETAVNDYELMSAKYEEALRTLAELQDAVDEARQPVSVPTIISPDSSKPKAFLEGGRMPGQTSAGHLSTSRSLSSELYLAGAQANTAVPSASEKTMKEIDSIDLGRIMLKEQQLIREMEHMKRTHAEKEGSLSTLGQNYRQLQQDHEGALDFIEELKTELHRTRSISPTSPSQPAILRKSSQNLLTMDRAHRSLASLRNIAAENLEHKPDTLQNFETNLNTTMHELYQRSERVQVLEAELASAKKEMESKATIISGLTRERSSLKGSSPMDISVVSSMRDQLLHHENQMELMQQSHAAREKELSDQIDAMRHQAPTSAMPGVFPETPAIDTTHSKQLGWQPPVLQAESEQQISALQEEVIRWKQQCETAIKTLHTSQQNHQTTTADLESSSKRTVNGHQRVNEGDVQEDQPNGVSGLGVENSRRSQMKNIDELRRQHTSALEEVEEGKRYKATTERQLQIHAANISALDQQINEHRTALDAHRLDLQNMRNTHAKEIEAARAETFSKMQSDTAQQLSQAENRYEQVLKTYNMQKENEIRDLNAKFDEDAQELWRQIESHRSDREKLEASMHEMERRCQELDISIRDREKHLDMVQSQFDDCKRQLESNEEVLTTTLAQHEKDLAEHRKTIAELQHINGETLQSLEKLRVKEKKATRLVDELEEQIASNYDQHQSTSHRLSILSSSTSQKDSAVAEANAARSQLEKELEIANARLAELESPPHGTSANGDSVPLPDRTSSLTSTARKSASVVTLPSPPPAIPLPPLPNSIATATAQTGIALTKDPSPPSSNHVSHDLATSIPLATAQHIEDQEARIRTIEKHLFAEKQLTATLEEALVDLESQGNKTKHEVEGWKKKAWAYEDELVGLRRLKEGNRMSMQAVEEERDKRREAEAAREKLEERMRELGRKKKKGGFNCF